MFIFRHFFLAFTLIALAEVMAFVVIGEYIGLLWTVALVVLTAAIGVALLRKEGADVVNRIQGIAQSGKVPSTEIIEGVLLLIAGAMLLTPGFLTDIAGFIFLVKPSRQIVAKGLLAKGLDTYLKSQIIKQQRSTQAYTYGASHFSKPSSSQSVDQSSRPFSHDIYRGANDAGKTIEGTAEVAQPSTMADTHMADTDLTEDTEAAPLINKNNSNIIEANFGNKKPKDNSSSTDPNQSP